MAKRTPCPACSGVGRFLRPGTEHVRPNGTVAKTFPFWEDCATCDGTGDAS